MVYKRIVVALSLAALLAACSKASEPPAAQSSPPAPQVTVVTVHRESVPVVFELPGRTQANLVSQVRARVDGIVIRREFQEGSEVKAGQRLYQIDPAPYVAALNSAKAALQKAQASLASTTAAVDRYQLLVGRHAVSQQDFDNAIAAKGQAAADVAAGKAAVDSATINFGYTNVTSPISGRAGISQVTAGAFVRASDATLMTTVQSIDPIKVDLTQSSVEGLRLRRDYASGRLKLAGPQQANITLLLEDGSTYARPGTVQFTDITVDPSTGSVTLRALFPNPEAVLLPGMFVRARVEEGVRENAILVPQVGVMRDPQGRATALVVGPDNRVVVRTLQVAGTQGDRWIVQGGLEEGERVVVAGLQRVQPGATVRVAEANAAAAGGQAR